MERNSVTVYLSPTSFPGTRYERATLAKMTELLAFDLEAELASQGFVDFKAQIVIKPYGDPHVFVRMMDKGRAPSQHFIVQTIEDALKRNV